MLEATSRPVLSSAYSLTEPSGRRTEIMRGSIPPTPEARFRLNEWRSPRFGQVCWYIAQQRSERQEGPTGGRSSCGAGFANLWRRWLGVRTRPATTPRCRSEFAPERWTDLWRWPNALSLTGVRKRDRHSPGSAATATCSASARFNLTL